MQFSPGSTAGPSDQVHHLAFTYLPAVFNQLFQTAPIGIEAWVAIIGFAALSGAIVEGEKRYRGAASARRGRI